MIIKCHLLSMTEICAKVPISMQMLAYFTLCSHLLGRLVQPVSFSYTGKGKTVRCVIENVLVVLLSALQSNSIRTYPTEGFAVPLKT